MNGLAKAARATGVICGAAVVLSSACADNNVSIFVRQVQAPASGECSYQAQPSQPAYGLGVLDVMLALQYRAALLVGNQLVPRGATDMGRAETARVAMTDAEVHVEIPGVGEITSFTVPGNGFADPSQGGEPGWGIFMTILVDTASATVLRDSVLRAAGDSRLSEFVRVVASVKVFGQTLGGQKVESGVFKFPIEVCYGCLVSFPSDANDPALANDQPNCKKEGTSTSQPCLVGQDAAVDCRDCKKRLGALGNVLCEP